MKWGLMHLANPAFKASHLNRRQILGICTKCASINVLVDARLSTNNFALVQS